MLWYINFNQHVLITATTPVRQALPFQAQAPAGPGPCRNLHYYRTVQCRHCYPVSQNCLFRSQGNFNFQITAQDLVNTVREYARPFKYRSPRSPPSSPSPALSFQADFAAISYTRRNLYGQGLPTGGTVPAQRAKGLSRQTRYRHRHDTLHCLTPVKSFSPPL